MPRLKKIIPLVIFLLIINIVVAEELKITLVSYNPEKKSAQIRIANIGNEDYHDLTMAIDDLEAEYIVGLLRQENAIKIPKGIPPGKHTITVSTAEGVILTKEIDFPKSETQIKKELELKEQAQEKKPKVEETQLRVYETKKPIGNILTIIVILVLFLLLLYFIFKKKKR